MEELFPKLEGEEQKLSPTKKVAQDKKVYFIHVRAKNTRKVLSMYEMEDGSHAFMLNTKTLQDRKLRHITTTETFWGLQSIIEVRDMLVMFFGEPLIQKILNREMGQLKKSTGVSNTDKL